MASLFRAIGEHEAFDAKKCGRARNRAEIVRIANAVEHQNRLVITRPTRHSRRIESRERLYPRNRSDTAMQYRAGDARQFGRPDLTIGFARPSEFRYCEGAAPGLP